MFIKSIELNGFKPYGRRITIDDLDRWYNAITSINGKSITFEAVTFVLGLTGLSYVQVGGLLELLGMNGPAKTPRPNVTIRFSNEDKSQSPSDYISCNEITVTRKMVLPDRYKYLINGMRVSYMKVAMMFSSVSLDVMKPDFFIRPANIKILNLTPPEILEMVDESTEIRFCEIRKREIQEAVEQTALKLKELNYRTALIFSDTEHQVPDLKVVCLSSRLYEVSTYLDNHVQLTKVTYKLIEGEGNIKSWREDIKNNENKSKELDKIIEDLNKKLDESQLLTLQLSAELQDLQRKLERDAHGLSDAMAGEPERLRLCQFKYIPPEPNFDAARVFGTVCELIEVCDLVYATAIEKVAGNHFYKVVVDTEETRDLLSGGILELQPIYILLNGICPDVINPQTMSIAHDLGGGPANVQLALELITYPPELRPVMALVFGNTLVCRDLEIAKRLVINPSVRCRCVTLDGDVFDPWGLLVIGPGNQSGSVLEDLAEQRARRQLLAAIEKRKTEHSTMLAAVEGESNTYDDAQQRLLEKNKEQLEKEKEVLAQYDSTGRQRRQELAARRLKLPDVADWSWSNTVRDQIAEAERLEEVMALHLDRVKELHERDTLIVKYMEVKMAQNRADIAIQHTNVPEILCEKDQLAMDCNKLEETISEFQIVLTRIQGRADEYKKTESSMENESPWLLYWRERFERENLREPAGGERLHVTIHDEYKEFIRQEKILKEKRANLLEVLQEVDEEKQKIRMNVCEKLNRDFASILSTLLPDAQARLRPPDGHGELDGLEINVGFNNEWNTSLVEMPERQRALVALALNVALLLQKPAKPLYLLEKVDATVDLKHMQKIIQVLKDHFKNSQIIFVSDEDVMLNNAMVDDDPSKFCPLKFLLERA